MLSKVINHRETLLAQRISALLYSNYCAKYFDTDRCTG